MAIRSAGILLYRRSVAGIQVLLGHPGGPFWSKKDRGSWSIPKGVVASAEKAEEAALREFAEEVGQPPPGLLISLGQVTQKAGKVVEAFALEGDFNVSDFLCTSMVEIEWPPRSGARLRFAEVDRVAWLGLAEARLRILPAQAELIDRLELLLNC